MTLKTLSTTALLARLESTESAVRWRAERNGPTAERLADEWRAISNELNARPTCEVLAAL